MSETPDDLLRFQVNSLTEDLNAEAFLDVFRKTLGVLASINRELSDFGAVNVEWRISALTMRSPAAATLWGHSTSQNNGEVGSRIVQALVSGVNALEQSDDPPQRFSERALGELADLSNTFPKGVSTIQFERVSRSGVPKESARVTSAVTKNARQAQQKRELDRVKRSGKYRDFGTLEGRLRDLLGSKNEIVLIDEITGQQTKCSFSRHIDELDPIVRRGWKCRVEVSGEITYDRYTGEPVSVQVEDIRILRDRSELPQLEDIRGIDITGGMESSEYVRNMRDGD